MAGGVVLLGYGHALRDEPSLANPVHHDSPPLMGLVRCTPLSGSRPLSASATSPPSSAMGRERLGFNAEAESLDGASRVAGRSPAALGMVDILRQPLSRQSGDWHAHCVGDGDIPSAP